jgi:hypothetical protein
MYRVIFNAMVFYSIQTYVKILFMENFSYFILSRVFLPCFLLFMHIFRVQFLDL